MFLQQIFYILLLLKIVKVEDNVVKTINENKIILNDFYWNFISVAIMGVAGILFLVIISIYYDADTLGVFNQMFAWYGVLSQLLTLGIPSAIIKYVPNKTEDDRNDYLTSAVLCVILASIVGCAIILVTLMFFGNELRIRLIPVVLALFLFPTNKVLQSYINAIEKMRAFAVFQATRYIGIVFWLWILSLIKIDGRMLSLSFVFTEMIQLVVFIIYFKFLKIKFGKNNLHIGMKIIEFGCKILPANLVVDITSKVDIIMLGLILHNDFLIGIYSFATVFSNGLYQIFTIVRKLINPKLAKNSTYNKIETCVKSINRLYYKKLLPIMCIITIMIFGVYYILASKINNDYLNGIVVLLILIISILLNGRFIMYGNLLAQIGRPDKESTINIFSLIVNICFNIILIRYYGTIGAATATALSYFAFSFLLSKNYNKIIRSKVKN